MTRETEITIRGRDKHARVYSALAAGFDLDLQDLMKRKTIVVEGKNARARVIKLLELALEPEELAKALRND